MRFKSADSSSEISVGTQFVKRFRDETCTLRLCEGADLFAQIQQDLSPWRKRGGISARDVDSAMMAGIKGCK